MKPFTQSGAAYFVHSFSSEQTFITHSVDAYLNKVAHKTKMFTEGTPQFDELRDCLLRESERYMLLSGNCYARALDGLRAGSAYWSVVGLYYSAFYSTKAILGMYGCWMNRPSQWLEVVNPNPSKQCIAYKQTPYPNSAGVKGSHKVSWVAFYAAMNHLASWLTSPDANLAINPVNSNKTWMIDTRNEVNYNSLAAFQMKVAFETDLDPANIPTCFSGKLPTMITMARAFVLFAKETATNLGLSTDVCKPEADRKNWYKKYVTAHQLPELAHFATSEYIHLQS